MNLVEIARLAGTSKSTVSRVLRDQPRVSPQTREHVKKIMAEYNYQPSLFARGLSGARTGLIGVLGRWMESGFFAEVIRGIDLEARKHGGHVLSTFADDMNEYIDMWWNLVMGGQVDGLILIAPPVDIFERTVLAEHKPQVLCSAYALDDDKGWGDVDCVRLKNREAMGNIVKHLAEQGCKTLVHLAGSPDNVDAQERSRAFTEYTTRGDGMQGVVVPGAWTREMGRARTEEYLQAHGGLFPDAIVAFNDAVALGALEALNERKIMVPEDVALTGWDDVPFSAFAGLTSVHIPMLNLGAESARLLFQKLDHPDEKQERCMVGMDLPLIIRHTSMVRAPSA